MSAAVAQRARDQSSPLASPPVQAPVLPVEGNWTYRNGTWVYTASSQVVQRADIGASLPADTSTNNSPPVSNDSQSPVAEVSHVESPSGNKLQPAVPQDLTPSPDEGKHNGASRTRLSPQNMSPELISMKRKRPESVDGQTRIRLTVGESSNTPAHLAASDEHGARTRSRSPIKAATLVNIPDPPSITFRRAKDASPAKEGLSVAARRAPRKKRKWFKKGQIDPDDPVAVAKQKERFAMIDNAMLDLDLQEEMIESGTHQQLQTLMKELDERFEKQMRKHKDVRLAFEEEMEYTTECEDLFNRFTWQHHRSSILHEMQDANQRKFNQLDREANSNGKLPGVLSHHGGIYGQGGWGVYIDRLFSKGTVPLAPVYVDDGRRVGYRRDISVMPDYLEPRARTMDTHDVGLRVSRIMLPWSNSQNRPVQGPGLYPTAPSGAWPTYYAYRRHEEDWEYLLSSDGLNDTWDDFDAREAKWKAREKEETAAASAKVQERLQILQDALVEGAEPSGTRATGAGTLAQAGEAKHTAQAAPVSSTAQTAASRLPANTAIKEIASSQSRPPTQPAAIPRASPALATRLEHAAMAQKPVAPVANTPRPRTEAAESDRTPLTTRYSEPQIAKASVPAITAAHVAAARKDQAVITATSRTQSATVMSNGARLANDDARAQASAKASAPPATTAVAAPTPKSVQATTSGATSSAASAPRSQVTSAAPASKPAATTAAVRPAVPSAAFSSSPAVKQTNVAAPPTPSTAPPKASDATQTAKHNPQTKAASDTPRLANGHTPSVLEPPLPTVQPEVEPEDPWKAIQSKARFKSSYDALPSQRPSASPVMQWPQSQSPAVAVPPPSFGAKSASPWGGPAAAATPTPPLLDTLRRQSSGSFGLNRPSPFGSLATQQSVIGPGTIRARSGASLPDGVRAIRTVTDEMLDESRPTELAPPTASQRLILNRRPRENSTRPMLCEPPKLEPIVPTIQYKANEDRYLWRANMEWGLTYEREDAVWECHTRWDAAQKAKESIIAYNEKIHAANRTEEARKAREAVLRANLDEREERFRRGDSETPSEVKVRESEEDELVVLLSKEEREVFSKEYPDAYADVTKRHRQRITERERLIEEKEYEERKARKEKEAQEEKIKREKAEKRNAQARERRRLKKLEDAKQKALTAENLAKLDGDNTVSSKQNGGDVTYVATSLPKPTSNALAPTPKAAAPAPSASTSANAAPRSAVAPTPRPTAAAVPSAQGNDNRATTNPAPVPTRAPAPAPARAPAPASTAGPVGGAVPARALATVANNAPARAPAPAVSAAPARTPVITAAPAPARAPAPVAPAVPARAHAPTTAPGPARAPAPANAPTQQQRPAPPAAPTPAAARTPCPGCGKIHQ